MSEPLDQLVRDVGRAGATAGRAWIDATSEILIRWLGLANIETGESGFNRETVVVGPRLGPTDLHAGTFVGWDRNELTADKFEVEPKRIPAGGATTVVVKVKEGALSANTPSGTYTGKLEREDGAPLVDEVCIYVVGDIEPPPPPPGDP